MNIQIEKQTDAPEGEVVMTVTIPFAEQKTTLTKAARKLSETKPIKGFRPGKATYEVVEKTYGGEAILYQALDDLVWKSLQQAVKQEQLQTIGQPNVEPLKQAYGNDFQYKVTLSLVPEVKLGAIDDITVKPQEVSVQDKEVDQVIKNLRDMRASEAQVDRGAKNGDLVDIDFAGTIDKVAMESSDAKGYKLLLGDGQMIPGFEDEVIGMKTGDKKTFTVTFPKDYKKDLAGKKAEFTVTMNTVFERKLPKLDDEFAKTLGQDGVDGLKKAIKDNLEQEARSKEEQRQELEILNALVEKSTFGPIPKMLLDNEKHRIKHELEDDLAQRGTNFQDYLLHIKKKEDEFFEELTPKAQVRVKTALLTRHIGEKESIVASEEQIDAQIEILKGQYQGSPQALEQLATSEYRDYVRTTLSNQQVISWLKKQVLNK